MNWQKIILPTTCTCLLPSIKWTKANHQCVTIRTGSENNLCNFSTDAPVSSWSRRNLTNHTPPPPGPNSRVMGAGLVKRRVSAQHLALVFFLWTSHSLPAAAAILPRVLYTVLYNNVPMYVLYTWGGSGMNEFALKMIHSKTTKSEFLVILVKYYIIGKC